jgi:hypothetical protein
MTCLVVLPALLYIWEQSHFQYSLYWEPSRIISFLHNSVRFGAIAVLLVCGVSVILRPGGKINRVYATYVLTCGFFLLVSAFVEFVPRDMLFKTVVLTTGLIYVVSNRARLERFLWLNLALGIVCIALNAVPVLDFFDILTLPYKLVDRGGSGGLAASLIPLRHYGLFGLTEAFEGVRIQRLQGWSFEPIHWAYFVLWTAVCCFLLMRTSRWRRRKWFLGGSLIIIGVHLWYVKSATALIVVAFSTLVTFAVSLLHLKRTCVLSVFAVVVLFAGLIMPSLLALNPKWTNFFYEEQILAKGENWDSNIEFVKWDKQVLFRLWPDSRFGEGAGHNLIFGSYLLLGIFLTIPLFNLEWTFLRSVLPTNSIALLAASLLTLIATNHQVPGQLFYPTGGMWLLSVEAAVRFEKQSHLNDRGSLTRT